MKTIKDEAILATENFALVSKSGVGINDTPWKGLEVVSTGLAAKHVVKIELETTGLLNFNGKPVQFKYAGAYVSHGMRMKTDSLDDTREFIEVLKEAVDFAEKVNKYLETLED